MKPARSVAVIIPVRLARRDARGLECLQSCLASVFASIDAHAPSTHRWEEIRVIVANDSSDDLTVLTSMFGSRIEVLPNLRSPGQAGALNSVLAAIETDIYIFLDSDCVMSERWISTCAMHYATHDECLGFAGPNWVHARATSWWSELLTQQESKLTRYSFCRHVDAEMKRTARVDCRNLSLTRTFLERFTADRAIFPEESGPSVSNHVSIRIRALLAGTTEGICYSPDLVTTHSAVESLRSQIKRSFRFGRRGSYWRVYAADSAGLFRSFVRIYIRRHFVDAWRDSKCVALYVLLTNGAFWLGIWLKWIEERAIARRS